MSSRDPVSGLMTLEEVAGRCGVTIEWLEELVRDGVVELEQHGGRRVRAEVKLRIQRAVRLERDLGVNAAGVAVIIELLERIDEIEEELRHFRAR
ncbi:MAG TPA: chaperone modulator CbpM [Polyangiaceae bacterium]|jgi:DNA-binding transcriptional MerR regulator